MDKYGYAGPEDFRPLSPWAYFGYSILFSIPVVGFIVLLVLSFGSGNVNRRNFARSYWCILLLVAIAAFILYAWFTTAAVYSYSSFPIWD